MAKWTIDPDHSSATFSIRHMMVTNVRGQFGEVSGTLNFDPDQPDSSYVEASISVASLSTGNAKRDEHLFSPDFFDVSRYPNIAFMSAKVELLGENRGRVRGDLTIHGVTRPAIMEIEYAGPVKSPADLGGETTIGFTATTVIDREDYGITWNVPIGDSGVMVGKEVRITLDIEADLVE